MEESITEAPLSSDHPELKAWNRYKESARFANSMKWVLTGGSATEGSMWSAFDHGWTAAKDHFTADRSEVMPEKETARPMDSSMKAYQRGSDIFDAVMKALNGSYHALQSYAYGNGSPELAQEVSKQIQDVLDRLK